MKTATIKYENQNENSDLLKTLNLRVRNYFEENNLSETGEGKILIKAIIFLLLWFGIFALILIVGRGSPYLTLSLYFLWAFPTAGIGFCIKHDANHGTFSKNKKLNRVMTLSSELVGTSHLVWTPKHNNHHSYVNTSLDDDIQSPLRMSPEQPWKWWHKYQHKYALALYGLLYTYWIFGSDFRKYLKRKIHKTFMSEKDFTLNKRIFFFGSKLAFILAVIVTPAIVGDWKISLIGFFFIKSPVTSIIITVVFQLAHVVSTSAFTESSSGKISHSWAKQQIIETSNFQTNSKLLTWFTGALNFQIEHHLFPKISHVHLPNIQPIVQEVCAEYGLKYNNPSLKQAFLNHLTMLKSLGQKP